MQMCSPCKKALSCLAGIVLVLCVSACGQDRVTVSSTCEPWAEYAIQETILTNNVWGKRDIKDYRQCIHRSLYRNTQQKKLQSSDAQHESYGWEWQWPAMHDDVKSYPSILFGHKPWRKASTTKDLPIKLADVQSILIDFNVEMSLEGSANLLLESWVTSGVFPSDKTRTREIAIHLAQINWPGMPGKKVDSVIINGKTFDVYIERNMSVYGDKHSWSYLGFVHRDEQFSGAGGLSGKIELTGFLTYLAKNGYVKPDEYLASVELGNEVIYGKGKLEIEQFHVTVEKRR
jgi:hypothetical protein